MRAGRSFPVETRHRNHIIASATLHYLEGLVVLQQEDVGQLPLLLLEVRLQLPDGSYNAWFQSGNSIFGKVLFSMRTLLIAQMLLQSAMG